MITFKQYLQEKAMHRGVYADTVAKLADKALVGFEVEFRVDMEHDIVVPGETIETESIAINDLTSLGQFEQYFEIPRETKRDIQSEYEDWVTTKEDDWIDENWENYLDDDEVNEKGLRAAEKSARAAAHGAYDGSKLRWRDWMREEYKTGHGFVNAYTLTPKFGFAGDTYSVYTQERAQGKSSWMTTAEQIAKEVSRRVKAKVRVQKDPGGSSDTWKIVPDTSITDGSDEMKSPGEDTGFGMEIVSPPLPYEESMNALESVLHMIDDLGFETNKSTGIHLNMSIPGIKEKLDPLKLILFIGDKHVLSVFDRTKNMYAKPQIQHIIDGIQVHGSIPRSGNELIKLARESISQGKFVSVNISKLENGYIEFRSAGGENYHRELDKIKEAAGRWLTAIDIACDRDAERKEYLKKVVKLLDYTYEAQIKDNSDRSFDEIARKVDPENWGRIKHAEKSSDVMREAVRFAQTFAQKMGSFKPTAKQMGELRAEFKRLGITAEKLHFHQQMNSRETTPQAIDRFISMMKVR